MPVNRVAHTLTLLVTFLTWPGAKGEEWRHPSELRFPTLQFHPPKVKERTLKNGVKAFLFEDHELPIFSLELWVRGGRLYDPAEKAGLGELVGRVMRDGGTGSRVPEKLNAALEMMAATVETFVNREAAGIRCSCLSKDMGRTLEILADVLLHPAFREEKLRQRKQEFIEEIRRRDERASGVAFREFVAALYGKQHPSGRRSEPETITVIERGDLVSWHERYFVPRGAVLAAAGDFNAEELVKRLNKLFDGWHGGPADLPEIPRPAPSAGRLVIVDKDLEQVHIRIGHLGIRRHNPDRFALIVMNEILGGGSFASRLVKEVRSRRGLAYSVWSYFTERPERGYFVLGCETKTASAGEAIRIMLNIMRQIASEPVSHQELSIAKESILNSFVFRFDSPAKIVTQEMYLDFYGYPRDYLETYAGKIQAVSAADVLRVARKYLQPDKACIVVVGRKSQLLSLEKEHGPARYVQLRDYDAFQAPRKRGEGK